MGTTSAGYAVNTSTQYYRQDRRAYSVTPGIYKWRDMPADVPLFLHTSVSNNTSHSSYLYNFANMPSIRNTLVSLGLTSLLAVTPAAAEPQGLRVVWDGKSVV